MGITMLPCRVCDNCHRIENHAKEDDIVGWFQVREVVGVHSTAMIALDFCSYHCMQEYMRRPVAVPPVVSPGVQGCPPDARAGGGK